MERADGEPREPQQIPGDNPDRIEPAPLPHWGEEPQQSGETTQGSSSSHKHDWKRTAAAASGHDPNLQDSFGQRLRSPSFASRMIGRSTGRRGALERSSTQNLAREIQNTKVRTRRLSGVVIDGDTKRVVISYEENLKASAQRQQLLEYARRFSPLVLALRTDLLSRTVIVRICAYPLVWIVCATYVVAAVFARRQIIFDYTDDDVVGSDHLDSAAVLVTFTVVFYLGYCYSRHVEQYFASRDAISTMYDCCCMARVTLNEEDRHLMRAYLLLLLVTAYCGLSPSYNRANFMDGFCEAHKLLTIVKQPEIKKQLATGNASYHECCTWAIGVAHASYIRGAQTIPPRPLRT